MERPHVFVVGTGAVGVGLARALRTAGWPLAGAWNRAKERAVLASTLLGIDVAFGRFPKSLGDAGLVLVCVSDDVLGKVGAELAASGLVRNGAIVAHTSGCAPSTKLGDIPGAHLGSLHPLVAISDVKTAARTLRGATFALEGAAGATALLTRVVTDLGGRSFNVPTEAKPRYHAAAVMASNLLVALLGDAVREAEAAGLAEARTLITTLARGAVQNVADQGAAAALTGPVKRGDTATIGEHLDALEGGSLEAYRVLSTRALALARESGLPEDAAATVEWILDLDT